MFARRILAINAFLTPRMADSGPQEVSGTVTVDEALKAEDARYAAQTGGDYAALEKMVADELFYVHSSGTIDTKQSYIESMRSGTVRYKSMKRGEAKVRTYGPVAIITGHCSFQVHARGNELALELHFHSVWAKRAGGLQFISWQSTKVPA